MCDYSNIIISSIINIYSCTRFDFIDMTGRGTIGEIFSSKGCTNQITID
jgi:hypothetical protein